MVSTFLTFGLSRLPALALFAVAAAAALFFGAPYLTTDVGDHQRRWVEFVQCSCPIFSARHLRHASFALVGNELLFHTHTRALTRPCSYEFRFPSISLYSCLCCVCVLMLCSHSRRSRSACAPRVSHALTAFPPCWLLRRMHSVQLVYNYTDV